MMAGFNIISSGDSAVFLKIGDDINPENIRFVDELWNAVRKLQIPGLLEVVPSYTGLMVYYNPLTICFNDLKSRLDKVSLNTNQDQIVHKKSTIEIPVCYGSEYGEDLAYVATINKLSQEDVIRIHSDETYHIYMLGFLPGFPYMGGMNRSIATPRRSKPRLKIIGGSVGIAGEQTGIYPLDSPGGWQIIGRTPIKLFDPSRDPVFLLKAGLNIKFKSVDKEEYEYISRLVEEKKYTRVMIETR